MKLPTLAVPFLLARRGSAFNRGKMYPFRSCPPSENVPPMFTFPVHRQEYPELSEQDGIFRALSVLEFSVIQFSNITYDVLASKPLKYQGAAEMQGVQRRPGLNEYAQVVLQLAVYVSLTEDG
ncbi:hypothetical protein [Rhodocista pekingensis]|uniref:Uncharacterized protein n=1 Tax=Rhodocista pekingensis TaxID=201185 RepID=A0ABW2KRA1_9PROT